MCSFVLKWLTWNCISAIFTFQGKELIIMLQIWYKWPKFNQILVICCVRNVIVNQVGILRRFWQYVNQIGKICPEISKKWLLKIVKNLNIVICCTKKFTPRCKSVFFALSKIEKHMCFFIVLEIVCIYNL